MRIGIAVNVATDGSSPGAGAEQKQGRRRWQAAGGISSEVEPASRFKAPAGKIRGDEGRAAVVSTTVVVVHGSIEMVRQSQSQPWRSSQLQRQPGVPLFENAQASSKRATGVSPSRLDSGASHVPSKKPRCH